jgi:hypothetical protein
VNAGIREFVARTGTFLLEWGRIISGALSVPFIIAGLFAPNLSARISFALLAYLGLWVMVGLQAREVLELKERLKPKLRMFWDDDGCVKHMTRAPTPFVFFRVGVESMGVDHASDCKGFLTRIEKDGTTRWSGNNVLLTFAPEEHEDATSKTIRDKVPEYLDVISIGQSGALFLGTKGRIWRDYFEPVGSLFAESGEYILTIKVSGRETRTVEGRLKLCMAENGLESSMELLTRGSK